MIIEREATAEIDGCWAAHVRRTEAKKNFARGRGTLTKKLTKEKFRGRGRCGKCAS
jgi:hypothetical protein